MDEKMRKTLISIFSILIGVIFVVDGIVKLFGARMPYEVIAVRYYPLWLSYGVSALELAGGLLLLIEYTRFYGASLLVAGTAVGILLGAGATNYLRLALPVLFFLGSWIIAWSTMPERFQRVACSIPVLKMTHTCQIGHHH